MAREVDDQSLKDGITIGARTGSLILALWTSELLFLGSWAPRNPKEVSSSYSDVLDDSDVMARLRGSGDNSIWQRTFEVLNEASTYRHLNGSSTHIPVVFCEVYMGSMSDLQEIKGKDT